MTRSHRQGAGRSRSTDVDAIAPIARPRTRGEPVPVHVNLPTVLRSHAGGAKTVTVEGATVGEVLARPGRQLPRALGPGDQRRRHAAQVRERLSQRRRRPLPAALDTPVKDGDEISILPAVAGGAPGVEAPLPMTVLRLRPRADRQHPDGRHHPAQPEPRGPHPDQARGPEPGRFGQGPDRPVHDRGGGEGRHPRARDRPSSSRPRATPASAWR